MLGKKPLPQSDVPPSGPFGPESKTTKPGKFWLSLPRPYVSQAPMLGRPMNGEPVLRKICAGRD